MAGRRGVLIVVPVENGLGKQPPEKKLKVAREPIAFNDDDLEGTIQPHNDVLVVTTRIMGFIVKKNVDVFAWSPYEVPRVDSEFIVHKLNVDLLFPPKKQKPRRSAKEHIEAVRQEVKRLKEVGEIKEFFFPEWLGNTVVVRKKNGKWRVCVDFTDLNRGYPKDPFPMPEID
ncbi:uncharacterized protein LOC115984974 [Quercus lobata]|uniref:uncharacterized protein LOC115984974 n=1 Tax=Quercus lobata TaxID=97700 RepID=UPI001246E2B6|nr:uncharacterized protein LOC115984974 [Quercus lobata]